MGAYAQTSGHDRRAGQLQVDRMRRNQVQVSGSQVFVDSSLAQVAPMAPLRSALSPHCLGMIEQLNLWQFRAPFPFQGIEAVCNRQFCGFSNACPPKDPEQWSVLRAFYLA